MNEEEKKAVELLEDIKNNSWTTKYIMSSDSKNAELLLNLIEKLQKENEQLRTEVNSLKEEKEQYKNDYFNLYEQNKQYIHYSKIEELAEKIHNELDKNGITRAYQTIIDSYFDEVLGG